MEQRKSISSSGWPWKKKSSQTQVAVASPKFQPMQLDSGQQQGTTSSREYPEVLSKDVNIRSQRSESEENIINQLNEKRSRSLPDAIDRNDLVRQHAKVAEEAVSGWQKAEAEIAVYRKQLDEALQHKAAMEDQAQQYMRQVRTMREEQEKTIEDALINKSKELDLLRTEMEAKLSEMEHQLLESEAKNSIIMRSLQERSTAIAEITEEKSKAEAEARMLRIKMNTIEKENSRLRYEVHLLTKELEIRTDESEYSKKAAEISNKQYTENEKKIMKLETECQSLRELVRKKLPAIPTPDSTELPESMHRSDEGKVLEETKHVKETLAKLNNEHHIARTMHARCIPTNMSDAELGQIESYMGTIDRRQSSANIKQKLPSTSLDSHLEVLRSASFDLETPNLAACKAELDGANDKDEVSCAESWASALIAELTHFKKDNSSSSEIHNEKVMDLPNLGMADCFAEIESVASCSETKNEEKQYETQTKLSKGNDYKDLSSFPRGIALHSEKRNKNAKDILSSIKADDTAGSRFCISVTEIVQLVEALAHPLLYCIKPDPQDGKNVDKKANNTSCDLINESDLQFHIHKLAEIKERAVELRNNVSWVVVDFLEELAGVLNRLVKVVLYRNAKKDGCNSDEDFDDTTSEMSGIASATNRQQQQTIRRESSNNNAKGKRNLPFNNLPPSSLGHHFHYSLWKNNEEDDVDDDEDSTIGFPFRGLGVSKSAAASKTQVESQLKNADPDDDAQNERKNSQDFKAKYKEIQKEMKMDLRGDKVDKSWDPSRAVAEEGRPRTKMEAKDVAANEQKFHGLGRQSKASQCAVPCSTTSKDVSSTLFVQNKVENENLTYMPKTSTRQHIPHPHPSLNSKRLITPHNQQSSTSSSFFDFNSKFLKSAIRSTLSKSMSKSNISLSTTPLSQKPKSSNKFLTRLLSLGHTS